MALISSGIERVRAFELPCGIWADGGYVGNPRTALVKWRSVWADKFYQIYVNGQHAMNLELAISRFAFRIANYEN